MGSAGGSPFLFRGGGWGWWGLGVSFSWGHHPPAPSSAEEEEWRLRAAAKARRFFCAPDNRNLSVFVRGMLVDDDARDLLPDWAGFASGVIESRKLTPTASREDLQRDEHWTHAAQVVKDALIAGLENVARREPESWRRVLSRHNEMLLGAALCDDRLFTLLADELTIPTSEGDLPARVVLKRGDHKAYVTLSRRGGFEEMLFRALKVPIAVGTRYAVLPFLQRWVATRGGTVVQLGTQAGNQQVFRTANLEEDERRFLERSLVVPDQVIERRENGARSGSDGQVGCLIAEQAHDIDKLDRRCLVGPVIIERNDEL